MKPPEIGQGKRGLDGHLLYLLRQANAATQQAVDRALADLGLSLAQYSALTMINAYDALSNAELSRVSMMTPQSASETVVRLERAKLIRREADPEHGRVIRLFITGKGRGLLNEARRRTDQIEGRLLALTGVRGTKKLKSWLTDVAREFAGGAELYDK